MEYLRNNVWKIATLTIIIAFGMVRSIYIAEADILWQIRSGLDLLSDGNFYRPDTYSWVVAGEEYVSNSWLWNVLLASLYSLGGETFLLIAGFTGLMASLILAILTYTLRAHNISWGTIFISIAFYSIFSAIWLSGRPQLADQLILSLAVLIVYKLSFDSLKDYIKLLFIFTILIILWNNLHLTGPVGVLCFTAIYFIKQMKLAVTRSEMGLSVIRSFIMLVILFSACFVTPYGIDGVTKPLTTANASIGFIIEWSSPWTFDLYQNTISAIAIIVFSSSLIFLVKNKDWLNLSLALGLFVIASWQIRWVPFMLIMMLVVFSLTIESFSKYIPQKMGIYLKTIGFAVSFAYLLVGFATFIPQDRVSNADYGYKLVASVPANCKMFNTLSFGGPLILERPDVKVSFDGRNDLYKSDRYTEHIKVAENIGGVSAKWLVDNDIDCVLTPVDGGIREVLDDDMNWQRIDIDSSKAELWVKTTRGN